MLEVLGEFPAEERYRHDRSDGPRPLGRNTVFDIKHGRFYLGTAEKYEIAVHKLSNEVVRILRRPVEPIPVTGHDIDVFIEAELARLPSGTSTERRAAIERGWRDIKFPEQLPAYSQIVVDDESNVWVREFPAPGASIAAWAVFAPDGSLIVELSMPAALWVYEIGNDFVLGKWTGEDDLEHLRLYRLTKHQRR